MRRCVRRIVTDRPTLLVLAALLAGIGLGGCQQARSTWTGTREAVQTTFQNPCCPDPCGNVYSTPIYNGGCGGGQGQEPQAYGAFARHTKLP